MPPSFSGTLRGRVAAPRPRGPRLVTRYRTFCTPIVLPLCGMDDEEQPKFLNAAETARRLGVHRNTVLLWVREGKLPSARLPGARGHRFAEREVDRLLRQRGAPVASVSDDRITVGPELVTASQLSQWAKVASRDAQQTLPELVQRLLVATGGVVVESMPCGDGVSSEGWDGVAVGNASKFLPDGRIGFELGTSARVQAKAEEDYALRVADPLGLDPGATTFAFVTPHRWKRRAVWLAEKRKENVWHEVIVLDADGLEAWLRATPSVHYWISEHLGRKPRRAQTLGTWWDRFRTQTDPPLPLALFSAGRGVAAETLSTFLAGSPDTLVVRSSWASDVLAFVYAALAGPDGSTEHNAEPTVVVDDPDVWDDIVAQPGRVVLLPTFPNADIAAARAAGHHVILPVGRDQALSGAAAMELPKPARHLAAKAFEDTDLPFDEAFRLAGLARRNLPSLIRTRARDPRHARPPWSEPPDGALFAVLGLVGGWDPTDADHAIVEEIADRPWDAVEERLLLWDVGSDRPFVQSAGRWQAGSVDDLLALVGHQLSPTGLARWLQAAERVLLELDPVVELPDDERMLAGVRGIGRVYSATLRGGVARGAALLGANGGITFSDGTTAEQLANRFVRSLLRKANDDESGRLWRSLEYELPLLAEAAPEAFLELVHEALDRTPTVLAGMFRDQEQTSFLGASSPHTHLLWALETLCWSEDHILEATRALARLDRVDMPRGRLGNRPHRSLAEVLMPWIRHTAAALPVRLRAIDVVCAEPGETGWRLLMALWPQHSTASPPSSPRFRDWKPDSKDVQVAEWHDAVAHIVSSALRLAGDDPARWGELVGRLSPISPSQRTACLDALEELLDRGRLNEDDRAQLWNSLRETVGSHRTFADADWAMGESDLARIESLTERLQPAAPAERYAYLFDWRPDIVEASRDDHAAWERELQRLRAEAIEMAMADDGLDGLVHLIRKSPQPHLTGLSASQVALDDFEDTFIGWLTSEDHALSQFAGNWSAARAQERGPEWLTAALSNPAAATDEHKVCLALNAPRTSATWSSLKAIKPGLAGDYWRRVRIYRVPDEDLETALRELVGHDRPIAAVELAAHTIHAIDGSSQSMTPELAQFALDGLLGARESSETPSQMTSYDIGIVLDYLQNHGADDVKVAQYEFAFFRALEHHRQPRALERRLAASPPDWVRLVCQIYRASGEAQAEPTEDAKFAAEHAWWVLRGWKRLPGLRDDGSVDGDHLAKWVKAARLLLVQEDRVDVGDEQVGQVLAMSPPGADGIWPHEAVRDVIEAVGNHHIESGLYIGRVNSRGITSRDPHEGGSLERALAAEYADWARRLYVGCPRTARVLRRLAESYEQDARRHDRRLEYEEDSD